MAWYEVLERIEQKLDLLLGLLHTVQNQQKDFRMATQAELDALTASVAKNTSASHAAATALTGFVKTVSDLTAELKAALASATSVSDPAVVAAVAALDQNNTLLATATPVVAQAIVAGTPAA
jgi:hypothetical protein